MVMVLQPLEKQFPNHQTATFLWLILTVSHFVFNGLNYLQKQGVTMGSICSPSYANLFMDNFEGNVVCTLGISTICMRGKRRRTRITIQRNKQNSLNLT